MIKSGIDQDALIKMFSEASAKQGETLRRSVCDATLKALQGRGLTLQNMRGVLKSVTQATSAGMAKNPSSAIDVEAILDNTLAGMDAALLQAVEANRMALQQFVGQGVGVQQAQMKTALTNLEKMEDMFFSTIGQAAQAAGAPMQGPWKHVLDMMKQHGTATGVQATMTIEDVMAQAQKTLRDGRASSMRATQAMMDSYAALVSGVLIGMSEGLRQVPAATSSAGKARK